MSGTYGSLCINHQNGQATDELLMCWTMTLWRSVSWPRPKAYQGLLTGSSASVECVQGHSVCSCIQSYLLHALQNIQLPHHLVAQL